MLIEIVIHDFTSLCDSTTMSALLKPEYQLSVGPVLQALHGCPYGTFNYLNLRQN